MDQGRDGPGEEALVPRAEGGEAKAKEEERADAPPAETTAGPERSLAAREDGASPPATDLRPTAGAVSSAGPGGGSGERLVYQAGAVRRTLLSIVFLLLLPFFVSLPAMLYQRLTHQLWTDTGGFAIFALAFVCVMLLVVFELIRSIRSRVELGESALSFTLPAARAAAMPKLLYRRREIPYSTIEAVETRREIYGGAFAPVLLRGARIITKDGEKVPLGYVSEANVDPILPFGEIAQEVARRAGVPVTDRGNVRRELRKKLRGIQVPHEADAAIPESEVEALNRRHNNIVLALCAALFLLVAGGLMLDITTSSLDRGERAQKIVQETAKPSPQAAKR